MGGDASVLGANLARGFGDPSTIRWPLVRSSALFELKYGKALVEANRRPGNVPVFGTNGQCGTHDEPLFQGPGVVLGRKGQGPLGVEWVERDYWVIDTAYSLLPLRPDLDLKFAYYLIKYVGLNHLKDGTSNPSLSRDTFGAQLFPLPPEREQRAIAHILGTLDDKIELNRRTNETLEAMARALFKSWFVDFDPVRAKAQGQTPPGMDPATAALFPGELEDSELGEIPKGWRTSTLKEETTKIGSGATPRGGKSAYIDDGIALIRSQNVYDSQFVWDGLARITDEAATKLDGVTVEVGDVLLNITGASILRTCVVEPEVLPARVNQHVSIVRAKAGIPNRYIHFHLLNPRTKDYLIGMDAGASRQAVTKGHIESVPVIVPSAPVLARFDELVRPLFAAADLNNAQSRRLAETRDALLPRLLSGEVAPGAAESDEGET